MMEKPKKERRFLKTLGRVGEILIQEVLLKVGSNLIKRIGGKKTLPSILILFLSISLFAQYPTNTNKQRLGFQTTADGLVWRGSISDTAAIQPVSNQNAWVILDTVNLKIYSFDFTSNVWNQVGGGAFAQPIDSLFFKKSVPSNNVDTAKMRWDSELGTVVLGMYDKVPNELGFKNFWLVKNQTGSTIAKNSLVYASGTVGSSGRISVSKFIANGTIDAKYLLGITAHDLTDGEDGYVISFGKIRQVNTDTFAAGAILYPSPTVAGVWTDVEPIAPNIDMPIGFCINSSSNNGTIAIRVASGYSLNELHNVAIISPVSNASLYYSGGLWRDTTPTLLVSDTAAMLANYATKAYADTSGRFYARQDFTNVSSSTLTWTQSDTLLVGGVNVVQVYRNGQILLPTQYTIPTNASVVIGATAYKVGENYTVIFPRGGGAGSGGGSGSLTSISGGTGIIVNPNPITTTGTVSADTSFLFTQSDTLSLNLTNRFALKLNAADTASLSNRINAKGTGTVTSVGSGFGLLGGTITTTGTLRLDSATVFNRIRDSIVDVAIGNDTIKILKQEYNAASSSVLTWTITPKFPIQLKAYILVFRNGQLLNNNQYNLTDTNKITIVSTSFKIGANYTVATVSGIGSVGSAQAGNPVYPEAGIALSTGTTWASSITNNSANWNTAYNDKVNSLAVTGTTTKTITLTQQDGGTVSGNFSDNGSVTSVDMTVPTGLSISGQPITTSGTLALSYASGYSIPTDIKQNEWNTAYNDKINNAAFTGTDTKTLTLTQLDGGTLTAPFTDLQGIVAGDTSSMLLPYLRKADTTLMLTPYLRKADTTSMLLPYFRDTDTSLLNLTNRFAAKQNTLNGTGFVKASGTNITYDNSSYLRTGLADSSYLKLTGGTLTGALNVSALGSPLTVNSTNSNTYKFNLSSSGVINSYFGSNNVKLFSIADKNVSELFFIDTLGKVSVNATGVPININSKNNNFYKLLFSNDNSITGYLGSDGSKSLSIADGSANEVAYITYLGDAAFNGNITEAGNNVLNNLDTVSLSNRINGKVGLTGNESISGTKIFNNLVNLSNLILSGSYSSTNKLLGKNSSDGVGNITVGSGLNLTSDILTATQVDTTSLSNRINNKVGLTGNETVAGNKTFSGNTAMDGTVTMSSTSATPTGLIGINASNAIGDVTTVAQTGLFARGLVTNQTTSTGGVITIEHGLNFTPSMVFANLPLSTTNIVNVAVVDEVYILFVVRDGATNNVINTQNIPAIQWFAVK